MYSGSDMNGNSRGIPMCPREGDQVAHRVGHECKFPGNSHVSQGRGPSCASVFNLPLVFCLWKALSDVYLSACLSSMISLYVHTDLRMSCSIPRQAHAKINIVILAETCARERGLVRSWTTGVRAREADVRACGRAAEQESLQNIAGLISTLK